jgi:hypothetical protein
MCSAVFAAARATPGSEPLAIPGCGFSPSVTSPRTTPISLLIWILQSRTGTPMSSITACVVKSAPEHRQRIPLLTTGHKSIPLGFNRIHARANVC